MNLAEYVTALENIDRRLVPEMYIGLQQIGEGTKDIAKTLPGTYQPGWKPLAASTIADKMKKGFPVPSPLRRTGEMAESYQYELRPGEIAVAVGSKDKIALWQEVGTSRIPPRPVLARAMMEILPYARKVLRGLVESLVMGRL